MLKIENLSTSYKTIDGDVHVLKDINFEIKDNEIFGIAGESGCGKTTLLNTLYDIVDYPLVIDQGRVVLEGPQTIMLSAVEKGYGGCMIGSCKRVEILEAVELDPQRYSLALVLALGKPKEEVRMVPVGEDGSTTYYRDENQVHYVPKRALEDILV